jgi:hypothetical protein
LISKICELISVKKECIYKKLWLKKNNDKSVKIMLATGVICWGMVATGWSGGSLASRLAF